MSHVQVGVVRGCLVPRPGYEARLESGLTLHLECGAVLPSPAPFVFLMLVFPPALCPPSVRTCKSMASASLLMHAALTGTTQNLYYVHYRWVDHVTHCMGSHDLDSWITWCHMTLHTPTGGSPCSDPRGLHHPARSLLEEDSHYQRTQQREGKTRVLRKF